MIVYPLAEAFGEDVLDERSSPTFLGTLSMDDIADSMMDALPRVVGQPSAFWEDHIAGVASLFLGRKLITLRSRNDGDLVPAFLTGGVSLLNVLREELLTGRKPVHRTAVFDVRGGVVAVATQTDIVAFMAGNVACLGDFGSASVVSSELGSDRVVCVNEKMPAIEALIFARSNGASAVGLINDDCLLTGNLSASDLRGVVSTACDSLALPAKDYLSLPRARSSLKPLVALHSNATVGEVVTAMAAHRVHRAYIVDAAGRPERVVTCTDLLRAVALSA
jgi:CBS domain-containing protein